MECSGTPLSWEEQISVRERVAFELTGGKKTLGDLERWFSPRGQDLAFLLSCIGLFRPSSSADLKQNKIRVAFEVQKYRARKAAAGGFDRAPPASGVNAVAMGSNQVMQQRLSTEDQDRPSRITAAFAILHRIPGVMQAVRDAAMALKRDRMEAGLDSQDNDRVTPACKAPTANPSNQPGPEGPGDHIHSDSAALDGLISAQVDKAIQRTLAQDDTVLQPPKIPAAKDVRPHQLADAEGNEVRLGGHPEEHVCRQVVYWR
jgi:hypothetical protein